MKELMHKASTAFLGLTAYPLHLLSYLVPKDKKKWVFIGWHRSLSGEIFADNTKYLFLHVAQNAPDMKAIWLAKDRTLAKELHYNGYESYYENSFKGIWHALRAGFTVIDAYMQKSNFRWSGGSKIVQLLHGKGMKKQGYGKKPICKQDYIFHTSGFAESIVPNAFKEGSKNFITGYPRNDVFFRDIKGSEIGVSEMIRAKINSIRRSDHETKIFWYSPTFRRGQRTLDIESMLDITKLSDWLVRKKAFLFISLHPKYREQARKYAFANIIFFDESDVYPLMKSFDCLISDYSSIFVDFLLTGKPIIFYPFDLKEYEANEGLSADYDSITPGKKAFTPSELLDSMEGVMNRSYGYESDRDKIAGKYHEYRDGNSSIRILDIIKREESL